MNVTPCVNACTIVGGGGAESLEVSELVHAGTGRSAGAGVLHLATIMILSAILCAHNVTEVI